MRKKKNSRRCNLRSLRDCSDPFSADEIIFTKYFRLPKDTCRKLIIDLQPWDIQTSSIPFVLRALSAIHFLSQGSYQKSIASNYIAPTSQPMISRNISFFSKLLVSRVKSKIKFPQNTAEIDSIKEGFYEKLRIKCTLGAIDCTHIAIISPPVYDERTPARLYMNRKGYYSINVECICDSDLRFISANARFPGSCHDSAIWTTSPPRMALIKNYDSRCSSWLIGDSGYPLEPWLLTPIPTTHNRKEEKFNLIQRKARNSIERAFGV